MYMWAQRRGADPNEPKTPTGGGPPAESTQTRKMEYKNALEANLHYPFRLPRRPEDSQSSPPM